MSASVALGGGCCSCPKGAKHYGYMDPNQWKKFAQFFADNGEIKALPPTDDVLTNDLLPGTQQP